MGLPSKKGHCEICGIRLSNKVPCRCGQLHGEFYPSKLNVCKRCADRTIDKLKGKCVVCGDEIPRTWEYYDSVGNYCRECLSKIGKEYDDDDSEIIKAINEIMTDIN